jgi:hypothetical protein
MDVVPFHVHVKYPQCHPQGIKVVLVVVVAVIIDILKTAIQI